MSLDNDLEAIYLVHMNITLAEQTAEEVRKAVALSGRTGQSISDETGIPYSTWNRKVKGRTEFSLAELYLIAEALGVTPYELIPSSFKLEQAAS